MSGISAAIAGDDATQQMPRVEDPGVLTVGSADEVDFDIADLTSELRVDDLSADADGTIEQARGDDAPTLFSDEVFGDSVDSTADTGINSAIDPNDSGVAEVGTKLDLARAYVDMGDPEGARSILGEVMNEGDNAQRQEAQALLDTLG